MSTDEDRVQDFAERWILIPDQRGAFKAALHALLRQVRDDEQQQQVPPDPDSDPMLEVMGRAEGRIRQVLTTHGAPGAKVTLQVLAAAHREVARIFKEELMASGMGAQTATAVAGVLAAVSRVKVKK